MLRLIVTSSAVLLANSAVAAMKRRAPSPVASVTVAGVRSEAVPFGKARGFPQNGGYVAAVDPVSGRELWVAKVYDEPRDETVEGDIEDVFITSLRAARGGRALLVANERGDRFVIDLAAHRSRPQ